ncbi:MAG TPA: response regulator [Verrucomicrobiae bacterium]
MLGKILLVEDSETDAILIKSSLNKVYSDVQLHVVRDGQQAMDYLSGLGKFTDREKYPFPQLVLLDLKLPGISGLEVLRWIRSTPALAGLIIVVLTCSDFPADTTQAYNLGANSVLRKPSSGGDMAALLKSIIDYWARRE